MKQQLPENYLQMGKVSRTILSCDALSYQNHKSKKKLSGLVRLLIVLHLFSEDVNLPWNIKFFFMS